MKKLNIMALICLFSLFVNRVYGQVVEVSGHVYERLAERSEPIPGVTVMIRGEKGEKGNGALTKMDGSFRLKADRNATLIFSYMGFRTVEMKVAKAKKNMDVFMEESVNTMDETVVVAYQSQSRADVGASVTVVNTFAAGSSFQCHGVAAREGSRFERTAKQWCTRFNRNLYHPGYIRYFCARCGRWRR